MEDVPEAGSLFSEFTRHRDERMRVAALAVLLLVGCSAAGSPAPGTAPVSEEEAALPACPAGVVGAAEGALGKWGEEGVRRMIAELGWADSTAGTTTVVAVDRHQRVRNAWRVQRALEDEFPTDLRDRGVGGSVTFLILLDADGRLVRRQIAKGASHPAFNRAAWAVLSIMEFSPAAAGGCRVRYLGELEVTFEVRL